MSESMRSGEISTVLVTKSYRSATGGRELLCTLNRSALHEILGSGLEVLEVDAEQMNGIRRPLAALLGNIDGINHDVLQDLKNMCIGNPVRRVFVDGSNLGLAARVVKSIRPSVEVITFFHNCEARFFWGAVRRRPSVKALGVLLANYLAERAAVRSSDKLICLTERDSRLLQRLYGRAATHIAPMAMQDQLPERPGPTAASNAEPYALFVGGAFYANLQGIEWYVDHVAARAPMNVHVVGKGLERWKERLERNGNVRVIGEVDDLASWYHGAQFVIAPIFDGSGMKTKVAEALMFGKRVVGTPEAFVGYEAFAGEIGAICANADDFRVAMAREAGRNDVRVDPELRAIYEANFSQDAARQRLAAILAA